MLRALSHVSLLSLTLVAAGVDRPIRLPQDPVLSPDARNLWFSWQGDVWTAGAQGGAARRMTTALGDDAAPRVSPDGKWVAFQSRRSGSDQVWIMPAEGGAARQLTFDAADKQLLGFAADGASVLVIQGGDVNPFRMENRRLMRVFLEGERAPVQVMDAACDAAALSPDGKKVLFTRGRIEWTRKAYRGAAAFQLWLADLSGSKVTYRRLSEDRPHFQNITERWPLWAPDGRGYYFVSDPQGTFEVFYRQLDGSGLRQITQVGRDGSDDGVAFPSLSADGASLLFRRGFDLWMAETATGKAHRLTLSQASDETVRVLEPRSDKTASDFAVTRDGKQMAFVAGDDIWVMDTVLKEPVRVTSSPDRETGLAFSPDGRRLYFTSAKGGEVDLYAVDCPREDGAWFLASGFQAKALTHDKAVEQDVAPDPTGRLLAVVKGQDLVVMRADGSQARVLVPSWSGVEFDWSPDGRWVVYSTKDDSFNEDIWVMPVDGSRKPFNLSRHPRNDSRPRWSSDGARIAWLSNREGEGTEIFYVNLTKAVEEETPRDRALKQAVEGLAPRKRARAEAKGEATAEGKPETKGEARTDAAPKAEGEKPARKPVQIDFEGLHERVHKLGMTGRLAGLTWSPDGSQLAFNRLAGDGPMGEEDQAEPLMVEQARPRTQAPPAAPAPGTPATAGVPLAPNGPAVFTVTFPDKLTPVQVAGPVLSHAQWLQEGNQIVGLAAGVPTALAMGAAPKATTHAFTVHTVRDWRAYREVVFDQAWRHMRDSFYDPAHNGKDWDKIRAKYRALAGQCLGGREFETLVNMMLGELNASHLGFTRTQDPVPGLPATALADPRPMALGLRFEPGTRKVASVIPGSPNSLERSLVKAGETLLSVDGQKVDAQTDLARLLTMPEARLVNLEVQGVDGAVRTVAVRPVASVSGLLYDEWVEANRREVERLSGGRLGYLHIQGMNMPSFRKFEEDLYHAGVGKEGLVIDVRYNGGGNTADHVLTALTQPVHAVTVPRGGTPGYPQDRMVYATWSRPIVFMCNEFSFSNAEIVSHAIKTLGRGRLVGMRTAGGVISTGAATLQDGSNLRMPTRGWFLRDDGADMELNGAEPHIALWNPPTGTDLQLEAAVKALGEDVAKEKAKARPRNVFASELRK